MNPGLFPIHTSYSELEALQVVQQALKNNVNYCKRNFSIICLVSNSNKTCHIFFEKVKLFPGSCPILPKGNIGWYHPEG